MNYEYIGIFFGHAIYLCPVCSSYVHDRDQHDDFHAHVGYSGK
jgi:hypothetical protein